MLLPPHEQESDDEARPAFRPRRRLAYLLPLLAFVLLDRDGAFLVKRVDDMAAFHGSAFMVIGVISGDVIEIEAHDALHDRATTQVRLWGAAAPQPPRPGRDGEPMWEESKAHLAALAAKRKVRLELESQRTRDPQGRLLAHVTLLEDGGTLNEAMLSSGMARREEQWPHAMLTAYAQAENRARVRGLGVWGSR